MSGPKSKPKTSAKKKAKAAPKRDNFLGTTTQKLRDSAGNVCSFPGCYVHTHGAKSNGEGTVGIGVACHIKAAAPGVPTIRRAPVPRRSQALRQRHLDVPNTFEAH